MLFTLLIVIYIAYFVAITVTIRLAYSIFFHKENEAKGILLLNVCVRKAILLRSLLLIMT